MNIKDFNYFGQPLPAHCIGGLEDYFYRRVRPGGFLYAVLCNNLMEAASCADHINLHLLHIYAAFLYNEAPIGSYGSKENVEKWLAEKVDSGATA